MNAPQNFVTLRIKIIYNITDNNTIRTNILDEWTLLDAATCEDAFIDVDLTDGSVKFIDADKLIKYDLEDMQCPNRSATIFVVKQ